MTRTFPIIGIGASAGGLDPLKDFFATLSPVCGMAFVVVTHRDPTAPTLLPEILQKVTQLTVTEAANGVTLEPNHVYISPPAHYLKLKEGKLVFVPMVMNDGITLPIDYLFRSMAEELQDKAICIVLSGNGSDGTSGLMAIKGEGGMAMAQELSTAQFTSMPAQAIATGHADYILPPEQMPEELQKYVKTMGTRSPVKVERGLEGESLQEILALVRRHNGCDFSQYKVNTLKRRIERRMNVHHISEVRQYVRYLKENQHEIGLLFKELLIGVTGFFRDPQAFEVIEKEVLPLVLGDKQNGDSVRIWIPGCSTGEEAYSFAMLLQDYMDEHGIKFNVQIFATDLDDNAINTARLGVYADGIALEVPEKRLKHYFTREDGYYKVRKAIREMVVFAIQNIIHDPPFTKLDLVSCRNLLIYLDGNLQKKVIPLFHYSLRPGGVMFLGSSESIGTFTEMFTPINSRWKIFRRKEVPFAGHRMPAWNNIPRIEVLDGKTEVPAKMTKEKTANITELAQRILLTHHIPPSLIVNEKGEIYFIHGRTGLFLEPRPGQPGHQQNALDMAREGLQAPLAGVIRKAAANDEEAVQDGVRVRSNGHFTTVSLRARKISEPEALRGLIWVSFVETGGDGKAVIEKFHAPENHPESQQQEGELQFIKDNLRNTIEELESANEELKSTNEELQSTNEELQSANEELETAKEEMQSLNEELHTVNAELETKVTELGHANDDMKNLLNSTGIATIFLDNHLHIKRFTSQARKIMRLIGSDVGRPISDIVSELEYVDLVKDATEVLQSLVFKEIEVRARLVVVPDAHHAIPHDGKRHRRPRHHLRRDFKGEEIRNPPCRQYPGSPHDDAGRGDNGKGARRDFADHRAPVGRHLVRHRPRRQKRQEAHPCRRALAAEIVQRRSGRH